MKEEKEEKETHGTVSWDVLEQAMKEMEIAPPAQAPVSEGAGETKTETDEMDTGGVKPWEKELLDNFVSL